MADWRKLALATILADGKIDDNEIKVLKKELWEDGTIDQDEVKFLIELRNTAQKKAKAKKEEINPKFEKLFFQAIEENVLKEGGINAEQVTWLREMLFADKKIDEGEKKFLNSLKKKAKTTSPEFDALFEQASGAGAAGAGKKKKAAAAEG